MKRSIFLSIILSLFLVACIPQAMAQKQSRLEKLLRYLNDNDADKWQKNRDKIDEETQTYYAEELALLDVPTNCGTNKVSKPPPTISAVTNKLRKLIFRISAKKRKYSFPTYKTKRNRLLSPSWKHRKSRFPLARH